MKIVAFSRFFWIVIVFLAFFTLSASRSDHVYAQAFCEQCGSSSGSCNSGLACILDRCIAHVPSPTTSGPCFDNGQCSSGFHCSHSDGSQNENMITYCQNNDPNASPTGTCKPDNTNINPPTYTCANRGGQCAAEGFNSAGATCTDSVLQSNCNSGIGSNCWINPYDATGVTTQSTDLGSCVTKAPTGGACGKIGASCCISNTNNSNPIPCLTGKPSTSNYTDPTCQCVGVALGDSCSNDSDCISTKCGPNSKCEITGSNCINLDSATCQNASGSYCQFTPSNTNLASYYCCPTASACTQLKSTQQAPPPPFDFCAQANASDRSDCGTCVSDQKHIWTALGCIPTDTQGIIQSLLTIGLGLSGGVVLLSILAGAFMLATSAGEPKKVQEAQEMISSAIIGLLFVIFSVIILNFVGVSILHIPGFI